MSSATVTAKIGPGLSATSVVLSGITNVTLNMVDNVLRVFQGTTFTDFDVNASTTFTLTVSSGVYTLTVN